MSGTLQMNRDELIDWAEEQIAGISDRIHEEVEAGGEDSPQTEYQRGRLHAMKHAVSVLLGDQDTSKVLGAVRERTKRPIPFIVPLSRDGKRYGFDVDAG